MAEQTIQDENLSAMWVMTLVKKLWRRLQKPTVWIAELETNLQNRNRGFPLHEELQNILTDITI